MSNFVPLPPQPQTCWPYLLIFPTGPQFCCSACSKSTYLHTILTRAQSDYIQPTHYGLHFWPHPTSICSNFLCITRIRKKKLKKIKIGITYWYGNSSNYGQKKFQKRHFLLIGTILQPN